MRIAVRAVLLFLLCLTRIVLAQAVHGIDRAYMDTTCAGDGVIWDGERIHCDGERKAAET